MQKPDNILFDYSGFQIGQCRLKIQIWRTEEYYKNLPKISDTCKCDECAYFQNYVLREENNFFTLLKNMGVDLSKRPTADDILCIGDLKPNKLEYMGKYLVYGYIAKTSKKGALLDSAGNGIEVPFNNAEYGKHISFTVTKVNDETILFDFYIVIDKTDNSSS
jgi:hypothetical protein